MNEWISQVTQFQLTFENPNKNYKTMSELIAHRMALITEEYREFINAAAEYTAIANDVSGKEITTKQDRAQMMNAFVEMLDAICDMTVINIGTANLLGMDMEEAMRRVHKSNMSKLGADGKPIYDENGKVKKGPHYHKPENLLDCINFYKGKKFADLCEKAKGAMGC